MPNTTLESNRQKPSTPSLRVKASTVRLNSAHGSVCIPDRASSLKSASLRHIASQALQPLVSEATKLVHGYMVCGLSRDPADWTFSPQTSSAKTSRAQGSIGATISPSILGSIPPHDQDAKTAQMYSSAMKNAFMNDIEIVSGAKAPDSTCHAFVLQFQSTQSLYGVTLRLWVKIDERRRAKIWEVLAPSPKAASLVSSGATTWMPYCLTYLSYYPLFDLMSDYLRCSWMLYGKEPDKFNSEGVLRLMRMPPPKPEQFLRIDLEKYTFCYKLPTDYNKFQNFALWPIFCCLTPEQMVAVIEAALSPKGRIIFTSHHPAILTIVAESVRHYVKTWAGLYVPVVYSKDAQQHIDEPAPYLLGVTKQSRSLFTAPRDALLVDLDFQRIFTSRPPGSLSPRQRKKYAAMLSKVLGEPQGVPLHLRSAYDQKNQFNAIGALIVANNTVPAVKDPLWWDPVQTAIVMNHITRRVRQNYKLLAALGSVKQRPTKVSPSDLTDMIHDRNFLARSVDDAWQAYIRFKRRSDVKILDLLKREDSLEADLRAQKKEYTELGECTEALIEETRDLQGKVNQQMRDNVGLGAQLRDKTLHAKQLSSHVSELQSELKEAMRTLTVQQQLLDEVENSRNNNRDSNSELANQCLLLTQERDEAHRAVIHLTSLISSQITYIERVIWTLVAQPARPNSAQDNRKSVRRSFQGGTMNSPAPSPVLSQFPLLKPGHETTGDSRRHTTDFSLSVLSPLSAAIAAHAAPALQYSRPDVDEEPSMREKVGAVSATVKKINEQCRAAIKDLADKVTEIHARESSPTTPKSQNSPKLKEGLRDSLRSSSAPPPAVVPNAISRLIESSRREQEISDSMSVASSQISGNTKLTSPTSVMSSAPSLVSMTPTAFSETANEPLDVSARQGAESKSAIRIQSIAEEEDLVSDQDIQPTLHEPKSVFRRSSSVLGRALFLNDDVQ